MQRTREAPDSEKQSAAAYFASRTMYNSSTCRLPPPQTTSGADQNHQFSTPWIRTPVAIIEQASCREVHCVTHDWDKRFPQHPIEKLCTTDYSRLERKASSNRRCQHKTTQKNKTEQHIATSSRVSTIPHTHRNPIIFSHLVAHSHPHGVKDEGRDNPGSGKIVPGITTKKHPLPRKA